MKTYYDILDSKIKYGEATFKVAIEEDKTIEIVATIDIDVHAEDDVSAYAEYSAFPVGSNDEIEIDREAYKELFEELDKKIEKWAYENGYELYMDYMIARAEAMEDR